jgi:ABC-2 type transport system permease protein
MTWVIVRREYVERVRSRAFILGTAFTVVLFGLVLFLPRILGGGDEASPIGYLDAASDVAAAAEQLDAVSAAEEAGRTGGAPVPTVEMIPVADRDRGIELIRSGDIDALLVDETNVVVENDNLFGSGGVPGVVRQAARLVALEEVVAEAGISDDELSAVLGAGTLEVETLDVEVDESRTVIAYAGMMLTYVALLLYGTWMLLGVTEEKSSRVVEIILSSVRPATLLAGKVIGIGLVALTQLGIVFLAIGALLAVTGQGTPDVGAATGGAFEISLSDVPLGSMGMLLLWFVVGFSIYNVLYAAIGSLVSRVEDAQNANIPLSLLVVGSLILSFATLNDPDGPLAVVATYIPFSAPFAVPIRYALEAIEWWEVLLSLTVSVVVFILSVRAAGRIYEGAILRSGARVKIREAWRGDR